MRFEANAIEDENVEALEARDRFVGDEIQIGRVGEIVEAIRDDGELAVYNFERRDLYIADAKWRVVENHVRDKLRKAAAEMRRFEDVLKDTPEVDPRDIVRKYRHRAVAKIERPNVIEAENMIDVAMRYQHRIHLSDICPQRLLPKICRCIDQYRRAVVFD